MTIQLSPEAANFVEAKIIKIIYGAYETYRNNPGMKEPVFTAGILADELATNYRKMDVDFMDAKQLRPNVESILRKLERAGKLKTSIALKGNREVRAYEPVD